MSRQATGRRIDTNEKGKLWLGPGDYGKDARGVWACQPPGTDLLGGLRNHDVTEHEDGTITVHPSILINRGRPDEWHGWLKRGIWTW